MLKKLLLFFVVVVGLAAAGRHDVYSNNSVHNIKLRDKSDQDLLHKLESELDLDIWQYGMPLRRDAHVMVTAEKRSSFLAALDGKGVEHHVKVPDVAKHLEEEEKNILRYRTSNSSRMVFEDYPRYAEVDAYMETIARQYPNLVTLVNAGQSSEGRVIKYMKISTTNFEDRSKPIYFMSAMLHAREWVTTPVALYSIFRLVEDLKTEESDLLNDIDWIIMPLANPDGYEYSHTGERLWRKTRSTIPGSSCLGVDPNRNFDINFNTAGVSSNPCSLIYPGTAPFSEPETAFIRNILSEYLDRIEVYMDIHSYGNLVLFAYGDASMPPNAIQLHHMSAAMGAAIDAVKLREAGFYLVGNSARLLYFDSGTSTDYGSHVRIPFSLTLELPGYDYMFEVPPQYQDQINTETWRGIAVTARYARSYYRERFNANTN